VVSEDVVAMRVELALAAEEDQWNVAADGYHWVLHVPDPQAAAVPGAADATGPELEYGDRPDAAADPDAEEDPGAEAGLCAGSPDGLAEVWCDPETGYLWDAASGWWHDPASGAWWADGEATADAADDCVDEKPACADDEDEHGAGHSGYGDQGAEAGADGYDAGASESVDTHIVSLPTTTR
jgi:hypothetical protein